MQPLGPDPQPFPVPAASDAPASPAGEARPPEALREEAVQTIAREDERAGYRRGTAQLAAALSDQGLAPVDNQELFRLFQLYKELRRQQRSQAVVGSPGLQAPAGPAAQTQPVPGGAGAGTTGPVSQGRDGAGAGRRTRTAAPKVLSDKVTRDDDAAARILAQQDHAQGVKRDSRSFWATMLLHWSKSGRSTRRLPFTPSATFRALLFKAYQHELRCLQRQAQAPGPQIPGPSAAAQEGDKEEVLAQVLLIGQRVKIEGRSTGTVLVPMQDVEDGYYVWRDSGQHLPAKLCHYDESLLEPIDDLDRLEALRRLPLKKLPLPGLGGLPKKMVPLRRTVAAAIEELQGRSAPASSVGKAKAGATAPPAGTLRCGPVPAALSTRFRDAPEPVQESWHAGDRITIRGRKGTLLHPWAGLKWSVFLEPGEGRGRQVSPHAPSEWTRIEDLDRLTALRQVPRALLTGDLPAQIETAIKALVGEPAPAAQPPVPPAAPAQPALVPAPSGACPRCHRFRTVWPCPCPPAEDRVGQALWSALHQYADADRRWQVLADKGATDRELREVLGKAFGIMGGSGQEDHWGGKSPRVQVYDGPLLQGKELLRRVRELLQIPLPRAAPVSDGAPAADSAPIAPIAADLAPAAAITGDQLCDEHAALRPLFIDECAISQSRASEKTVDRLCDVLNFARTDGRLYFVLGTGSPAGAHWVVLHSQPEELAAALIEAGCQKTAVRVLTERQVAKLALRQEPPYRAPSIEPASPGTVFEGETPDLAPPERDEALAPKRRTQPAQVPSLVLCEECQERPELPVGQGGLCARCAAQNPERWAEIEQRVANPWLRGPRGTVAPRFYDDIVTESLLIVWEALALSNERLREVRDQHATDGRQVTAGERSPVPFLDKQIKWARENNKPSILAILVQVRQDVDRALRQVRDQALRQAGSAELTLQVVVAAETRAREAEAAARILTHQRDSALAAAQSNLERATARAHKRAEEDFGRDLALIQQAHQADLEKVQTRVHELQEQLDLADSAAWEAEAQRLSAQTTARRGQQALYQDLLRERALCAAERADAAAESANADRAGLIVVAVRTECTQLLAQQEDRIAELSDRQEQLLEEARTTRWLLEEARGLDARVRASEALLEALGPPPMRALLLSQLGERRDRLAVQQALQIACTPLSALALQGRGATEAELSSLLSQLLRSGSFTLGPLQVQYEPGAAALWIRYDQGPLQLLEGHELLLQVRALFQIPHRVGAGGRLSLPSSPRISPRAFPCPVCPAPGGRVHTCCTCRHPHHGHAPGQCGCSADGIGPVLILFGARRKPNGRVLVISHCRSCRKKGRPRRQGPGRREPVAFAGEGRP